jgi:predicted lipoprotein with Yx(FWY)xxD motif
MKEYPNLHTLLLIVAGAVSVTLPASAAPMLTGKNGMTVYVDDRDVRRAPTCYDACAKQWPPYLADGSEKRGEGWGTVTRKDGSMQWTYRNRPLYFYADDKKAGDTNGNGVGRIWHTIKQ